MTEEKFSMDFEKEYINSTQYIWGELDNLLAIIAENDEAYEIYNELNGLGF